MLNAKELMPFWLSAQSAIYHVTLQMVTYMYNLPDHIGPKATKTTSTVPHRPPLQSHTDHFLVLRPKGHYPIHFHRFIDLLALNRRSLLSLPEQNTWTQLTISSPNFNMFLGPWDRWSNGRVYVDRWTYNKPGYHYMPLRLEIHTDQEALLLTRTKIIWWKPKGC